MSDKSISDDAKEYLSNYSEGIFDILDIEPKKDTTLYKIRNTPEIKYIAIGLFFAAIVHIYSFINYGWKPILYTPFFIKEDPFIFISWLGGVGLAGYGVYNIIQSRMKGNDHEYDSSYRAIHSAWHTYRNLQNDNLSDAVKFWENGGYYTQKVGYNGPDELRNLYEEYTEVENGVEFLRENLPQVLEEVSGSEISEVILPYIYFEEEYHNLVTEINKTYNTEAYKGCSVLLRNLCETLLINIMEREYSKEEYEGCREDKIKSYMNTDNGEYESISGLVYNFIDNIEDFKNNSSHLQQKDSKEKFKQSLETLKEEGNSAAHTAKESPKEEDIEKLINSSLFALYVLAEVDFKMRVTAKEDEGRVEPKAEYIPEKQTDVPDIENL